MPLDKTKLSDGNEYEDISRLNENNLTSFKLAITMFITSVFPAQHTNGKLENKTYILGTVEKDTVITGATIVVNTPMDNPVLVDVGTLAQPKLFVDAAPLDAVAGTIVRKADCNFVATKRTPILLVVTGATPTLLDGTATVSLEGMKTGTKTYYPS